MLLEITRRGFVASPLTQVVEVPSTRAQLRAELGLATQPLVLLRVGRAPLTPASRRRRLVDVLVETSLTGYHRHTRLQFLRRGFVADVLHTSGFWLKLFSPTGPRSSNWTS